MVLIRIHLSIGGRAVQVCFYSEWSQYHRCRFDHTVLHSIDRFDLSEEGQQCIGILVDVDRAENRPTRARLPNLQTLPAFQGRFLR